MKKVLRILAVVLAALALLAAGLYLYMSGRTNYVSDNQVQRQEDGNGQKADDVGKLDKLSVGEQAGLTEETETESEEPPFVYDLTKVKQPAEAALADCYTMLIICGDSVEEQHENGDLRKDAEGIILMTINHRIKEMFFTTLHADLYVEIPDAGEGRLGHAYAVGGGPLLTETIRTNYGIDIGNYAMISLRDVARELEMEEFEDMDISRDGLDVVEKLIYSLNYDNPLQVAAALNRILAYVTHNMTVQDIAELTLQIPVVLPYYSEKLRIPQDGEYVERDGYLLAEPGEMSRMLQEKLYAG
ncbi:MAG: LCP family protein [Lachnospiraceae bacterium]|nr:LCP family protein [Lachnospiraceae bacterium]